MQQPKRIYVFAGVLALLGLGGIAFASTGGADGDVGVQQAYFVTAEPAGDRLNLTASLFVTNSGLTRSDDLAITVFVVPTHSGLATYTNRVDVGSLGGRTTQEVAVPVVIPDFNATRSYRVDFLVFEDGLLTQKGTGGIGWGGGAFHADRGVSTKSTWSADEAQAAGDGFAVSAPSFERVR